MKNSDLCRFPNLRSTTFSSMTWEEFFRELLSDKHKRVTEAYRATLRELSAVQANEQPDADLEAAYKRLKGEYKMNQPAVVAMCSLEGGRTNAHVTGYTGVIMVDIDDLTDDEFPDILARVKGDKCSMLVHTTLSGLGIRVFCRMAGEVSAANFGACWQAVNRHYARLAGVEVDEKCKNPTRMSVICYDPDAQYRPDAEAFPMPEVKQKKEKEKEKVKAGRKPGKRARYTPAEVEVCVRRLLEKEGARYQTGRHNDYIHRALSLMNRFGVGETDATQWALEVFADADAPDNDVAAIARSCYRRTGEHDTLTLKKAGHRLRGEDNSGRSKKASVHQVETFLRSHCGLRLNGLLNQLEISLLEEDADGVKRHSNWTRMTDRMENSLWRAMLHEGLAVDINTLHNLLQSDLVPVYHPMVEYLSSLPEWDKTTDFIGILAGTVHCRCCDAETFRDYFTRWLVGMVASAMSDKVVNHVIFTLLGPQGSFKSSFMENLLPPPLRQYYTVKTNSQRLTKDDAFTITENLLVNFEEIDSLRRSDLNQLKALTTTNFINERPAYGRNKMRLAHVASFCATGNNLQFLTDLTGNRRWLPFEVERIDNPWTHPVNYEGVYAQAKALYESGYRYWFDAGEVEELNRRNRRFEEDDAASDIIMVHYRRPLPGEQAKYVNIGQLMARFGGTIRLNTNQWARALKKLEFDRERTRNGRFWRMVERTPEEMAQTLPEAIVESEPGVPSTDRGTVRAGAGSAQTDAAPKGATRGAENTARDLFTGNDSDTDADALSYSFTE